MADEFDQYARKPQSSQTDDFAQYARNSADTPTQQLTNAPTVMDRVSTEVNGGGAMLDPQKVIEGVGNSLGRTTQAWGDMLSGNANPSTLAEMVPLLGPMAVDASQKMFTPGHRVEGLTDAAMMLSPGLRELPESTPLNLAEGDVPTPGFGSRAISGVKAGSRGVGSGLAKIGAGATAFEAIPGEAGRLIVGYPLVKNGLSDLRGGIRAGIDAFRGPAQGPELAPKGFVSPYDTFRKYEAPLPSLGPRETITLPSGQKVPVMPFEGHDFTPPQFERPKPIGQPGAVLPSGSVVGPAPPSRVNPPLPRGNAPRVPMWQRTAITGEPQPVADMEPIYPRTPVLESGRTFGSRPSLAVEPNRGTVVNGPTPIAPKSAVTQPELDILNQQLRDSLKARGIAPNDTPSTIRSRANGSRAKFDENGKRNQLK